MTQEQQTFVLSERALQKVVKQIRADQWNLDADAVPHMGGANHMKLRDLINRHIYDDAWVPDTLAGKTIAEVGEKYEGDLLGPNPTGMFASYMEKAIEAVEALLPTDLDKIVHLTYGDFPVREYLKHITSYRGFRSYTLAKFLDLNSTMPADLVQGLWDQVLPDVEQWRAMGVFGPAVDVPAEADLQTKLLGITGFLQS